MESFSAEATHDNGEMQFDIGDIVCASESLVPSLFQNNFSWILVPYQQPVAIAFLSVDSLKVEGCGWLAAIGFQALLVSKVCS